MHIIMWNKVSLNLSLMLRAWTELYAQCNLNAVYNMNSMHYTVYNIDSMQYAVYNMALS